MPTTHVIRARAGNQTYHLTIKPDQIANYEDVVLERKLDQLTEPSSPARPRAKASAYTEQQFIFVDEPQGGLTQQST